MDADVVVTQMKLIEFRRLQKTHHRHFKFYATAKLSGKALEHWRIKKSQMFCNLVILSQMEPTA